MKIDNNTKKSIIRNVFLSLFIYVLPILLMFLSFYITGKRPWEQKLCSSTNQSANHLTKTP
ncbi:MAG: hypothetical protein ACXVB0_15110 [Mucilaginibacter sp.]